MKNIDIVFICDNNYLMPTIVAIESIRQNRNPENIYNIFILTPDKLVVNLDILKDKNFNVSAKTVHLNQEQQEITMQRERVTNVALLKFDIAKIFPNHTKILYLDSDMLILKDLAELFSTDIKNCYAAVVKDTLSYRGRDWHLKNINFQQEFYFNSGMLLLNLEKIREDNIPYKLLEYRKNKKNYFMDQDALNMVFDGKVRFVSVYYNLLNCFFEWDNIETLSAFYEINFPSKLIDIYDNAVILHYGDKKKPWTHRLPEPYLNWLFEKYYYSTSYKYEKLQLIALSDMKLIDKIERFKEENSRLQNKLNNTRNSVSYKIGRIITWLPRFINKKIRVINSLKV